SDGRLSVGELFVKELQWIGATREFSATVTLTGIPALATLGALEDSPRWRDVRKRSMASAKAARTAGGERTYSTSRRPSCVRSRTMKRRKSLREAGDSAPKPPRLAP